MTTPSTNKSKTINQLRDLAPKRALSISEAKRIAELQASKFRSLVGDEVPSFDLDNIRDLPKVQVRESDSLEASGATHWHGAWRITIRSDEALVRQRFTLAHEFKHVLDAPIQKKLYARLDQRIDARQQKEAICDHFSACLLMPKRWVSRLWGEGIQDLQLLADSFEVSSMAMRRRLTNLRLIDRQARPITKPTNWTGATFTYQCRGPKFYRRKPAYTLQQAITGEVT